MYLVTSLISIMLYWVAKEFLTHDDCLERIKECVPHGHFIRKGTKEKYTYYQFMMDGKDVNVGKIQKTVGEYLGKSVKVFFERVLTIRVYKSSLPNYAEGSGGIGIGLDGVVTHDFNKFPHMIVAGTTGYGKTNFLKTVMKELKGKVIYLDLKSPDVEIEDVEAILEGVELKKRRRGGGERLFIVVDEAAELLPPSHFTRKEAKVYHNCLYLCGQIARLGRELNVSLIYCTQYPTADVLPREIKQNAEARVVFRLPTEVASRVALDESGAEKLPRGIRGRALYKTDSVQTIQTFVYGVEGEEWSHVEIGTKKDKRVGDYYTVD